MNKVDMNRFVRNITCLCKEKNIYIGDLERELGIAIGSLSRKKKGGSINLNIAYNISKILSASLEELIESDIELELLIARKQEELKVVQYEIEELLKRTEVKDNE